MFFLIELPVDCGPPQSIANASVNYTSTAESSVAVYECDEGFFQFGQFVSTCLRNGDSGRWSPDPSVVKCGSEPCKFWKLDLLLCYSSTVYVSKTLSFAVS